MKTFTLQARSLILSLVAIAMSVQPAFGWGKDGHKMINRVAIQMLPADMPAFLQTPQALDEIEFLGPEPDRWRSPSEPELNAAQAPDHFIDLELADAAAPNRLPARRFDFIRDLENAGCRFPADALQLTPQRVGLLPWQAEEWFERLEADMREYRTRLASHRPVEGAQQAVLYDAGVLGHYVADGSQPLHTTMNYDGWVQNGNPEGFTRARGIHSQFETDFVHHNIQAAQIRPLVPATPHRLESPFQDFVVYLRASHLQVTELYRLEKSGGFSGRGTPASREFTAERIAAGATMLRDLIYTAWLDSAEKVPAMDPKR